MYTGVTMLCTLYVLQQALCLLDMRHRSAQIQEYTTFFGKSIKSSCCRAQQFCLSVTLFSCLPRARLVAGDRGQQGEVSTTSADGGWAHDVGKPEKGCLLLAHPLMFGSSQGYFSQVCLPIDQHLAFSQYHQPSVLQDAFFLDSSDFKSESQVCTMFSECQPLSLALDGHGQQGCTSGEY